MYALTPCGFPSCDRKALYLYLVNPNKEHILTKNPIKISKYSGLGECYRCADHMLENHSITVTLDQSPELDDIKESDDDEH